VLFLSREWDTIELRGSPKEGKMGEFYTKIRGVTHEQKGADPQRLLRHCRPGQKLMLVREPNNKWDKNAIAICLTTGERLGYISRDIAERLAEDLDRGVKMEAAISELTGGGFFSGKERACHIKISS
jgi:hypothetical protein